MIKTRNLRRRVDFYRRRAITAERMPPYWTDTSSVLAEWIAENLSRRPDGSYGGVS